MNTTSSTTGRARVQRPERNQIEWRPLALDGLLPADHRARVVWAYVDSLDLSPLYAKIQAVEGRAGRDAVDPKILMALWIFATVEAVSSARQVARLCERDLAYLWICGGVGVNHHLLSDFRTAHGEFLDQLLTDTIATLMHQQLVTLEVVAQDGMRVRASAGTSSFRRKKTLQKCREEARQQVETLREEGENEPDQDASNARRDAARLRAASDRETRLQQALEELEKLQKQKEKKKKGTGVTARTSTTDPEARKMKMGDGGFRPAYNVQFATDGGARMIVGVDVTNSGSDGGQMSPMHAQLGERYGKTPGQYLVDGGFAGSEEITKLEQRGSEVYAPILREEKLRQEGIDPYARQPKDSDESCGLRQRIATHEAKNQNKAPPTNSEFPKSQCRKPRVSQVRVRGLEKVRTVTLWYALTFNFMRMMHLGCIG
jgi:transposase